MDARGQTRGGRSGVVAARDDHLAHRVGGVESLLLQQAAPGLARQQRMIRPQVLVGEPPPALGQAEHDVDPAPRRGALDQQQHAAGRQRLAHMGQRLAQVARGMQDVGRQHDVEALRGDALVGGRALDVEDLRLEIGCELLPGRAQEARRQVGEDVVRPRRRQALEHRAGRAAGAGADFEHAQRAAARQAAGQRLGDVMQQAVDRAGVGRGLVEGAGAIALRGEQQAERIALAGQHLGQRTAAAPQHADLALHRRRLGDQRVEHGIGIDLGRGLLDPEAPAGLLQHAVVGEQPQQAAQQPAMALADPQRLGGGGEGELRACLQRQAERAQRADDVAGRRLFEASADRVIGGGAVLDREPLAGGVQALGQHGRRRQEGRRGQVLDQRLGAPVDAVEAALGCRQRRRPEAKLLDRQRHAVLVADGDVGQHLAGLATGERMHDGAGRRSAEQRQAADAGGHHDLGAGVGQRRRHELQHRIEPRGMDAEAGFVGGLAQGRDRRAVDAADIARAAGRPGRG